MSLNSTTTSGINEIEATPIVIVGHVDHGKSTLIGRLMHDAGVLADGRVDAAKLSSAKRGLGIEWAFLLDSLQAERDQGVTIDSTRLAFALAGRPFVIVDAPGHRQFLRNVVTGAAGAAAAVLVVDAAEGAQEQTRRHAALLRMLGIRHVIVALNKTDKLEFDEARVSAAIAALTALLARMEIVPMAVVPLSARDGDNMASRSERSPWYAGPTLVEAISAVPQPASYAEQPLRLPVQDVYRFDDKRLVAGRIEAGRVRVGDTLIVGPAGITVRVASLESWHTLPQIAAEAGQSVALVLEPEVVIQRGDILYAPSQPPMRAARVRSRLFWLRQEPLRLGESFRLRLATAEYAVTVSAIHSVLGLDALTDDAADQVGPEGFAEITLSAPEGILFDPFVPGLLSGRGVLVDREQRIVGGAPLMGPDELASDKMVFPIDSAITSWERAQAKGHRCGVFWMTGLPGSGKSTLARAAERMLFRAGVDVVVLDGDTLRARLSRDLGFSPEDRSENIRRTAVLARLMADAGLVVLVALISPLAADRAVARAESGEAFREIHIHADVAVCETRDPKGLYAAARAGKISHFTGVSAPYEAPLAPELLIDTSQTTPASAADLLVQYVQTEVAIGSMRGLSVPGVISS